MTIADYTHEQLKSLKLDYHRPLLICDVDEVLVHFTRCFETYLQDRNRWLDFSEPTFNGIMRTKDTNRLVATEETNHLIGRFIADRTAHLEAIDGAVSALGAISEKAQIILLTNMPHIVYEERCSNLARLGLHFPIITNCGPKGPAIKRIAQKIMHPIVFIDDNPDFLLSAYDHLPHIHLVHFLHDKRLKTYMPELKILSLRTDNWTQAQLHILNLFDL